jgi:hypothetical protein
VGLKEVDTGLDVILDNNVGLGVFLPFFVVEQTVDLLVPNNAVDDQFFVNNLFLFLTLDQID